VIDHLRIAEAQLRGRPRQTAIALASVAVGVAMLLLTLSVTKGLADDFVKKVTETGAHVEVLPRRPAATQVNAIRVPGDAVLALTRHHVPDEKVAIRSVSGVLAALSGIAGVRIATPAVEAQAVLTYGTARRAVALSGVVPREEAVVSILDEKVIQGSWWDLARYRDGVILGSGLARALGVEVGSHLQAAGASGGAVPLRVVGVLNTGLSRIDKLAAVVNLAQAQALSGLDTDQATTVRIGLDDPLRAPEVAVLATRLSGYVARSWQERNAAQVDSFDRQNTITLVLVLFTTLTAAFGVANVLIQLVAEKRRDIAILRAAGFARHDIGIIYLHEGVLLGFLGAIAGWVVGAVLIRIVAALPVDFGEAALLRNEHLQMAERPSFYVVSLLIAVLVCGLASVGPARRAAALEPTAILRGEH
jgi:lipoprotein-releasing system permease protein